MSISSPLRRALAGRAFVSVLLILVQGTWLASADVMKEGVSASIVRASIRSARIGDALTFDLGHETVSAEVTWRKEHGPRRAVVAGRLGLLGSFAIATNGEAIYGHLRIPGRPGWVLRTAAEGELVLQQREPEPDEPFCEVSHQPFAPPPGDAVVGSGGCGDGSVIDVMVVYLPEVVEELGGVAEVEAAIDLAIAESNIAYEASGLEMEQRLVLAWQVDPGTLNANVSGLIDPADGVLDEVNQLRDLYGADLVALVRDGGGGFADSLETLDPAEEATAFCTAGVESFYDYVLPHELGHNMGCCHALGDGGGCGQGLLYPYSNGYRWFGDSGTEWRTVMAYTPGERILHFSNPEVEFDGHPTGVPATEPDGADNVATIIASAPLVSSFRCPGICNGSNQPSAGPDCNDNRIPDACDIVRGASSDLNRNRIPDDCEDSCSAPGLGPTLVVSSDVADEPDYLTIQEAVGAATSSGTRIQVLPGLSGSYAETVSVDRGLALHICGVDQGAGLPVVDGAAAPAFVVASTEGEIPVQLQHLELRGDTGLHTAVPISLRDLVFAGAPTMAVGLDIDGGTCSAIGLQMDETVVNGIELAAGTQLSIQRSSLIGLAGSAATVAGRADLTNVVIGGADTGVVLEESGALFLEYTTVASSVTGPGIQNLGSEIISISKSILYGNQGNDVVDVRCSHLTYFRSVVAAPPCGFGYSTAADPLLDAEYVPTSGSSALDLGPHPSRFSGTPCSDLPGGPRLLDHDGDGLAQSDAGAFEVENPERPSEVSNLRWTGPQELVWDPTPDAVEYHLYGAELGSLGYGNYGICADGLDPDRTDEHYASNELPSPGDAYFYLVTAEDLQGREGSLGLAGCQERSNHAPCD